jgi:hypothetical protein
MPVIRIRSGLFFAVLLAGCAAQPNNGSSGTIDKMIAVMQS